MQSYILKQTCATLIEFWVAPKGNIQNINKNMLFQKLSLRPKKFKRYIFILPSSGNSVVTSCNEFYGILAGHLIVPSNIRQNKIQWASTECFKLMKKVKHLARYETNRYVKRTYMGMCLSSARIALFSLMSYLPKQSNYKNQQYYNS